MVSQAPTPGPRPLPVMGNIRCLEVWFQQLLGQSKGIGKLPSPAYASEFLATSDGIALTKAFMRIKDISLRRRIVELVEEMAGDDSN